MRGSNIFQIDVDREFPHLPKAPIVEAVIHWQVLPSRAQDSEALRKHLEERCRGYSIHDQYQIQGSFSLSPEGSETQQAIRQEGFRLISEDKKYICQFRPTDILFSRMAPYERWPNFFAEALRFWDKFVEFMSPVAIERLGVRFINQIALKRQEQMTEVIEETSGLSDKIPLVLDTFFRQDILEVPDSPYRVNLVRTIQEPQLPMILQRSLILDIHVFATGPMKVDQEVFHQHLNAMRFLKNLVFFNFIKEAEKRFGEESA